MRKVGKAGEDIRAAFGSSNHKKQTQDHGEQGVDDGEDK